MLRRVGGRGGEQATVTVVPELLCSRIQQQAVVRSATRHKLRCEACVAADMGRLEELDGTL